MPVALVHDAEPEQQLPQWKRDLLRRLGGLQRDAARLFDEALAVGNLPLALAAMQRTEKQLWLEWQICEEPSQAGAVNVAVVTMDNSPRETIMRKLDTIAERRALANARESTER